MARITSVSKKEFQSSVERRLARREQGEAIRQFSRNFFAQVPLAEIKSKDWEYVEAVVYSAWTFFREFKGKRPRVRVFNPDPEVHGYRHKNTIVEIAAVNLPFLLESVRIELNHHGIALVDVEQCLLHVKRPGKGEVTIVDRAEPNETLIHLEVHRPENDKGLERDLTEVIRLVQCAIDDFTPMRRKLLDWGDTFSDLVEAGADSSSETYDTLQWLHADNFTFLGYEEFELRGKGGYRLVAGSELGLTRPGYYAAGRALEPLEAELTFAKSPSKSRVHRPTYFDEFTVWSTDESGARRAGRFIGLFTSSVFNQNPVLIPLVGARIATVFEHLGLSPITHKGRVVGRIIEVLPREELFLSSSAELIDAVESIYSLQERRIVRLIVRQDACFVNCMVYLPRDAYDTDTRLKIQQLLINRFQAIHADFSTLFSESALVRIHFVLRVEPGSTRNVDIAELESIITGYTRSWEDGLRSVLVSEEGEARGQEIFNEVRGIFPPGYRDDYWPATAYGDIEFILTLAQENPLKVGLYQWVVGSQIEVRFKIYSLGKALPLSDVIPILENLGARAVEEHPYEIELRDQRIWIQDFVLELVDGIETTRALKEKFEYAFLEIWRGDKENDSFNRLVTVASMDVRKAWLLRAYAHYLVQLNLGFSQGYIAECMLRHSDIARLFIDLFHVRFDVARSRNANDERKLRKLILDSIELVENLSDDRILRTYFELISATQRTNYFQPDEEGNPKDYVSFKLLPEEISEMPLPKPKFEIFVYSCRMEGLHLRGGKVARGGLRWSDRSEDYRTEVLGLVKAQQVKNSVIVPVGAKGGFLSKRPMDGASREEVLQEGIYCYRKFISGMLDITDNLVKGKVVPPKHVVRHDDDDYYLVVAADKGTATFSDIANDLAISYGFWLGDAFASGGSVGYDHKQMGITAKGAWESVQRHFSELDVNLQSADFTAVGIGDMSGDVFGNGMLLSEHIQLVAAFNHQHIFIDPEPCAETGFRERSRLFKMSRSSWRDYDASIISPGGGVFDRSAKSIAVTPQMKKRFGISEKSLTPNRLIRYILKSKVDLLWNGGIGTYVKSQSESHLDVGDKANDAIRINGSELRCRVIGEGGNLGLTQLGRIEFCLNGGRCFTDFIDNAGGVNCSDAEVNIKIFLNQLVERGELTDTSRKRLLSRMTDEVSQLVLENNYRQALCINLMQAQSMRRNLEYIGVMKGLQEYGYLNASLEYLPDEEEMQSRLLKGQALTSPELSVLASYVKLAVKERLTQEGFSDHYMMGEMYSAFPGSLVRKYKQALSEHRLRAEIVGTQVANNMINNMGMSFVARIAETTGASRSQIAHAYVGARDIFDMEKWFQRIRAEDWQIAAKVQSDMQLDLIRLVRRATRWLLRNRRDALNLAVDVPLFSQAVATLLKDWEKIMTGDVLAEWQEDQLALEKQGVDKELARFSASNHYLYSVLAIVEIAGLTGESVRQVAAVFYGVGGALHLHWFSTQMHAYQAASQWEALARESLQDDLNWQAAAITLSVIRETSSRQAPAVKIEKWMQNRKPLVDRWLAMQSELRSARARDISIFTVAIRELMDLSQSGVGTAARLGMV